MAPKNIGLPPSTNNCCLHWCRGVAVLGPQDCDKRLRALALQQTIHTYLPALPKQRRREILTLLEEHSSLHKTVRCETFLIPNAKSISGSKLLPTIVAMQAWRSYVPSGTTASMQSRRQITWPARTAQPCHAGSGIIGSWRHELIAKMGL